jgi:hypothetical protein
MAGLPVMRLLEYYDCSDVYQFMEQLEDDSVVPGVCLNCMTIIEEIEPDSSSGWCENCCTNNVKSSFVLFGII